MKKFEDNYEEENIKRRTITKELLEEMLLERFELKREYVTFNWNINMETQKGDMFAERSSIPVLYGVIITETDKLGS